MLRLLHVVPTYLPATRYGGPIYSVHGLCKALVARGHKVHIFTTNVDGQRDSNVPFGRPVEMDGVQVCYFRSRWLRKLYWSPAMAEALRHEITHFDLVHLHSVFLWPTWAGARAARAHLVPYVLAPRGMLVRDLIERRSKFAKLAWIHLIERRNIEKAAFIHVTSESERDALEKLGLALAPTRLVANGVDPPLHWGEQDVSGDIAQAVQFGPQLIYFGRINWKKGLTRLIQALALVPDVKALIAGNDEENHVSTLRRLVIELDLGDRIRILDRKIEGSDKEALFAAVSIVVLPSLSENFGNVVLEAMIRGRPVIASRSVGAAKIVKEAGAGLVFDGSPEDLARAIKALVGGQALREQMAAAGKQEAENNYRWSAIAQQMETYYEQCLNGGPPA